MINESIQTIANSSHEYYGNYSFAAGFYQGVIKEMFASLPKKEQARFAKELEQQADILVDRAMRA